MCIYSEFISWRRVVYRGCQNSPWRIGPSLCISLIAKKHAFGQCFGKQKAEPFKRCGDQELYKSNRKQCKKFSNHMRARVRKPGTMKGLKRDALMSIMICMVEDRKLLRNRLMKLLFMFHMATIGVHAAPVSLSVTWNMQSRWSQPMKQLCQHRWQGLPPEIGPNLCNGSICPPKQTDALIVWLPQWLIACYRNSWREQSLFKSVCTITWES